MYMGWMVSENLTRRCLKATGCVACKEEGRRSSCTHKLMAGGHLTLLLGRDTVGQARTRCMSACTHGRINETTTNVKMSEYFFDEWQLNVVLIPKV